MRILAVDDDDIALELLSSALKRAGYTDIVTAGSGADALGLIAAAPHPFDAFLLDIRMPGIDGIELCRQIKRMKLYRHSPVLMITAMQERHFIDEAFAAGAVDYVSKPFNPLELGVRVRIAETLVEQARRVNTSRTEVDYLKSRTGMQSGFDVDEPIEIHDVSRVISQTAMENYLLRLSLRMSYQSQSVTFAINGFRAIHAHAAAADTYDILADVASAIAEGLKYTSHLVSYVGRGEFVAVILGRSNALNAETLFNIQSILDDMEPCFGDGRTCPVTIQMGKVYVPSLWSATERLNLLLKPQVGPLRRNRDESLALPIGVGNTAKQFAA